MTASGIRELTDALPGCDVAGRPVTGWGENTPEAEGPARVSNAVKVVVLALAVLLLAVLWVRRGRAARQRGRASSAPQAP
jgi:hypothetical protein